MLGPLFQVIFRERFLFKIQIYLKNPDLFITLIIGIANLYHCNAHGFFPIEV